MTVVHVVGSLRAATKAADAGVDALVVEGVEGGGFKSALGASTMVLLPLVAERIDLPIIAAGGMCDARSAAAAVVLGRRGRSDGNADAGKPGVSGARELQGRHRRRKRLGHSASRHSRQSDDAGAAHRFGGARGGPRSRGCSCWARSPICTSTAIWRPASPTPVRCRRASPNCCRSPRSCGRRGPGSRRAGCGPFPDLRSVTSVRKLAIKRRRVGCRHARSR